MRRFDLHPPPALVAWGGVRAQAPRELNALGYFFASCFWILYNRKSNMWRDVQIFAFPGASTPRGGRDVGAGVAVGAGVRVGVGVGLGVGMKVHGGPNSAARY